MNSMFWKWLTSRTVRQAVDLRNQVEKFLNAQRDILSPQAVDALSKAVGDMQGVLAVSKPTKQTILEQMTALETVANKWLKAYPHASIRENVEVVLVAVAVALAIRTFFLQPFKIPTGSMQPTLYGITHQDLRNDPTVTIPGGFGRFVDSWFYGTSYYHKVAKADGTLEIEPVQRILPLVTRQKFRVGPEWYTVWFPPDKFQDRADLRSGQLFYKGDDIVKLMVRSGDHLFVDRLTFNFRRPTRGEIIVFKTQGIDSLPQDQYYIKRMVALGGEHVRIGNDHHLIIDGQRLDAATPRFENVYTFGPNHQPYAYFGHVNGYGDDGQQFSSLELAPRFPDENAEFTVGKNRYLVMGDNTLNSLDSRRWGDFPQENVIGKSAFVYWPISSRFGWSHR